jgi:hypothetical protein
MKKFFFTFLAFLSLVPALAFGQLVNIPTLDQWTSTSSPGLSITQRTYGKNIRLTGLENCNLDTDANGVITCGTDATGSGGGTYPFTPTTIGGTVHQATSSPLYLSRGLLAASSTLGQLVVGNITATSSATSTFAGGVSTAGLASSNGLAITGGNINFAGDSIDELVGPGLQVVNGDLQTTLGTTVAPTELASTDFGDFTCNGTTCSLDTNSVTINTASPLGGGGSVALGGSLNLTCTTCSTFSYPFISQTIGGTLHQATSSPMYFSRGLLTASTTAGVGVFGSLTATSSLNFGGVTGAAWSDFCVSITGSASLCDGNDASSAGGGTYSFNPLVTGEQSTSTTLQLTKGLIGFGSSTFSGRLNAEIINATSSISIRDWELATTTTVCRIPDQCQFRADGTADNVQIQQAINALGSGGGKVHIKAGTYAIAAAVTIASSNVAIYGDGQSTVIKNGVAFNDYAIKVDNASLRTHLTFKDFKIDGSKLDNDAGGCLMASSTSVSTFDNIWLTSCNDTALKITGDIAGNFGSNNKINNVTLDNGGMVGLWITRNDENQITNTTISSFSQYAFYEDAGTQMLTGGNVFVGGSTHTTGVGAYVKSNTLIQNNFFDGLKEEAIIMDGNRIRAMGNTLSGTANSAGHSLILNLGGSNNTITNNNGFGGTNYPYAYEEQNSPTNTFLGNNNFTGGTSSVYSLIGGSSNQLFWDLSTGTPPGTMYWGKSTTTALGLNAPTSGKVNLLVNNVEKLTVTSTGVGIGTTSPSTDFEVAGDFKVSDNDSGKAYRFRTSGSALDFDAAASALLVSVYSGSGFSGTQRPYLNLGSSSYDADAFGTWRFQNAQFGSNRLTINASGNLVINDSNQDYDFDVGTQNGGDSFFHVDAALDRVSIGTTTPGSLFSIQSVGNFQGGTSTIYSDLKLGNLTATNTLDVQGSLKFGGVTGTTWPSFCATITGSADLCDGNDATGAGGGTYPFTPLTVGSTLYQATTSPMYFSGGFLTGTSTAGTYTATSSFIAALGGATTPSYSFTDDPDTGIYSSGANQVDITAGGSAKVTIKSGGLYQSSSGNSFYSAGRCSTSIPDFGSNIDQDTGLGLCNDNTLRFLGNSTEYARFDGSGKFGIGTSSPGSIFSIQSVANFMAGTSTIYSDLNLHNINATGTIAATTYKASGLLNCNLDTDAAGNFVCGTDATGSGTYPFTIDTNYGTTTNSTSTSLWLMGGAIFASSTATSTFEGGLQTNGLTVTKAGSATNHTLLTIFNTGTQAGQQSSILMGGYQGNLKNAIVSTLNTGGATSDLTFYYGSGAGLGSLTAGLTLAGATGNFGIASSTPWGLLSVEVLKGKANNGVPGFVVGSIGTSTPHLIVTGRGAVGIATSSPGINWGFGIATSTVISGGQFAVTIASTTAPGATITVDWNAGNTRRLILAQNTSLIINATSSNPIDGGKYTLKVCQDQVGSRTITFITANNIRWWNGTTTITATANKCTYIGFIYDGEYKIYSAVASSTNIDLR